MQEKVLSVHKLNKYYGDFHAVKDVSFEVLKGEIVGFIGPNGAGKTTVMKCINSLLIPTSGTVLVCDNDIVIDRNNALLNQASLIESPALYTDLRGIDNLRLFAQMRDVDKIRIEEIIKIINIGDFINKRVSKYSLGMKQRLALGVALLSNPKLLILDEPMNGLDMSGVSELRILLENLAEDGTAILFSSHQLGEIEKIAHRIISINNGVLKTFDSELFSQYKYQITEHEINEQNINIITNKEGVREIEIIDNIILLTLQSKNNLQDILKYLLDNNIMIEDIKQDNISVEKLYLEMFGDQMKKTN